MAGILANVALVSMNKCDDAGGGACEALQGMQVWTTLAEALRCSGEVRTQLLRLALFSDCSRPQIAHAHTSPWK